LTGSSHCLHLSCMQGLTNIIRLAVLATTLLLPLSINAGPGPIPEGFQVVESRGCRFVVRPANSEVVRELAATCTDGADRIFMQLDIARDSSGVSPYPIEVRIVSEPAEMALVVPEGAAPPAWSHAVAYPEWDMVVLPLRHRDGRPVEDLDIVLEHEISHLALRRALEGKPVPRWFSEGIAVIQSEGTSLNRSSVLWWAAFTDSLKPLREIERYPESHTAVTLAYAQAADFFGYLLREEGWFNVRVLLRYMRRGSTFEEAFENVYGRSVPQMEKRWRERLTGGWGWVSLLTGAGAIWGAITLLFILAYVSVRRQQRQRLAQMEEEEEPIERLIGVIENLEKRAPDPRLKKNLTGSTGAKDSVVEIDGKIHTLH
jgi:peptidase MA superfamily protein